jgi:hypothetical protein
MSVVVVWEYPYSTKQRMAASVICIRVFALFCACHPDSSASSVVDLDSVEERCVLTEISLIGSACASGKKKSKLIETG